MDYNQVCVTMEEHPKEFYRTIRETANTMGCDNKELLFWSNNPDTIPQDERGNNFKTLMKICRADYPGFYNYMTGYVRYQERSAPSYDLDKKNTITSNERTVRLISDSRETQWGHYKHILESKGFENIPELEESSRNVVELLKDNTAQNNPNEGLIFGEVQSGKTANMIGIISMAADLGWNLFVILSGTIDNLREQTQSRMESELKRDAEDPSDKLRYNWHIIEPGRKPADIASNELQSLDENSPERYLWVCLKNSDRLRDLLITLQRKGNQRSEIRLIVIDDEADLASINTKTLSNKEKETMTQEEIEAYDERTKINRLIIYLINGKSTSGKRMDPFRSVNYLCYTATPYANLLNEGETNSPDKNSTLYPADFIFALTPSSYYLGLHRIFSGDDSALSNKMVIETEMPANIGNLEGHPEMMPPSMKEAIAWFICCVAIRRYWNRSEKQDKITPVSMLMNVDSKIREHVAVDRAVVYYLENCKDELRSLCREQYEIQTKALTPESFRECVPDYGIENSEDDNSTAEIRDYPKFERIKSEIDYLIDSDPTRINFVQDEETGQKINTYTRQIHICVDNSSKNSDPIRNEINFTIRIVYPSEKDKVEEYAPAFIVIGGNTLSRGLTIEGLVVSYFRRTVKQADTLLQMARWFGFRKGYELLPRIWMDRTAITSYEDLNDINDSLRAEIVEHSRESISPREFAVRIKDVPEAHMLKSLTSRNKMQNAAHTRIKVSFGNGLDKSISKYRGDKESLDYNLEITRKLLNGISESSITPAMDGAVLLYRGVDKNAVLDYLADFRKGDSDSGPVNVKSGECCFHWLRMIDRSIIKDFNIVLAGRKNKLVTLSNPIFDLGNGKTVNVVNRRAEIRNDKLIQIKTVRDKIHLTADIDWNKGNNRTFKDAIQSGDVGKRDIARKESGWDKTPLLLIGIANDEEKEYPSNVVTLTVLIPTGVRDDREVDTTDTGYVYLDSMR